MSLTLPLSPEMEAELQKRAAAAGTDVTEFVLDALQEKPAQRPKRPKRKAKREMSHEEWPARLRAWADGFPPVTHFVDDSRESIYE